MRFTRSARRTFQGMTAEDYIRRPGSQSNAPVVVTNDTALRHSGVWAALRLRADLISTFPIDAYRNIKLPGELKPIAVEATKPDVLLYPGGELWPWHDWCYASQINLDRCGNSIGLITARNALGLPARVELQDINVCSVIVRSSGELLYRIGGKLYDPSVVWHERQYPIAGSPLGLSPIAYAAWSISEFLSIQDFTAKWFAGGAIPKARMRNTSKVLKTDEVVKVKGWYNDTMTNGDLLVHGSDWEYSMIQAQSVGQEWLESKKFGLTDVARFFGVPSDLIEAGVTAGGNTLTYQNITQRNLEFLIMNLGPAVIRRENRISTWLPSPRYIKMNTDALLRLDPVTRAQLIKTRIDSRVLTNTEARALDNYEPLTDAEKQEFIDIYGKPKSASDSSGSGGATPADPSGNTSLVAAEAEMIVREARKEITA